MWREGDAPYLKSLADAYTMSDNYHQAVDGGTGANHVMLGSGDMIWYSDGKGHAAKPPAIQIENPDPQPGTNNFYRQDGYGGGSYVACADASQPGVKPILDYLARHRRQAQLRARVITTSSTTTTPAISATAASTRATVSPFRPRISGPSATRCCKRESPSPITAKAGRPMSPTRRISATATSAISCNIRRRS